MPLKRRFFAAILAAFFLLTSVAAARITDSDPYQLYSDSSYKTARQRVMVFSPDMTLPQVTRNSDPYNQAYDLSWASLRTFRLMAPIQEAPLKIYIENYPRETRLFKARYIEYVKEGLNAWSDALDGRLRYRLLANPRDAQIRVYWINGFPETDQAGETEYTVGDATVKIQTPDMPENILRANIMHELGHALGIGEHSTDNDDIMMSGRRWSSYHEYETYVPKLTERDKQAIRRLYSISWNQGEDLYRAIAVNKPLRIATAKPTGTAFANRTRY